MSNSIPDDSAPSSTETVEKASPVLTSPVNVDDDSDVLEIVTVIKNCAYDPLTRL